MTQLAPKAQLILDYKSFFDVDAPQDRISLIKHLCRDSILYEIVGLNYRLKPKNRIHIDKTLETQINELKYFTQTDNLYRQYFKVVIRFIKSETDYPIIFNRQACLFAIEEIINSNEIKNIENFEMADINIWEALLKYLLAVNSEITSIKEDDDDSTSFESLNPKLLPLNELIVEIDPVFTPYRGYWLIDYFERHQDYLDEIKSYFAEKYEIEPQQFIFHLLSAYLSNQNDNPNHNFFYYVNEQDYSFFDKLSIRTLNKDIYKLINIRKSPFIKTEKSKYLLVDNSFLIEKAYSQFINDFWFDKLKNTKDDNGRAKFNISGFRSEFGYFFEQYVHTVLSNMFVNYKYLVLLAFDQLKIKIDKKEIEIADIYIRHNNKIIIGQVKSGSIYDTEKYGGDVGSLYKNNREQFFENFGVNQIIESIRNMDGYISTVDSKFRKGHSCDIFPCIIVNDKSFQTPLMADTFNIRFRELLKNLNIKKINVRSLSLIHVSDLERLENSLAENPKEIWNILKYHHRDRFYVPPFWNTLNLKLKANPYPTKVVELFKSLVLKYNPNTNKQ